MLPSVKRVGNSALGDAKASLSRLGVAGRGLAGQGTARQLKGFTTSSALETARLAMRKHHRPGLAWHGVARPGKAGRGKTTQGFLIGDL